MNTRKPLRRLSDGKFIRVDEEETRDAAILEMLRKLSDTDKARYLAYLHKLLEVKQ